MQKTFTRVLLPLVLFFAGYTLIASAQTAAGVQAGFRTLEGLINSFSTTVVVAFGSLLMAGAVVIFFMGIVQYLWGLREGDSAKAKAGSNFMLWGLVALFVMFSVYGIVKFGQNIFFSGQDVTTITVPKIKFDTAGGATPATPGPLGGGSSCCTNGVSCTLQNGAIGTCRSNICQ
jgi:hypothetical protein